MHYMFAVAAYDTTVSPTKAGTLAVFAPIFPDIRISVYNAHPDIWISGYPMLM